MEGGHSGAFVARDGLVLTCQHGIAAYTARLAEAPRIDSAGWLAAPGEELRLPGLTAEVWIGRAEITDLLAAAEDRDAALEAAVERLVSSAHRLGDGEVRTRVVERAGGARTELHAYERIEDLRLVWAPAHQLAQFGGDRDNFAFPRYCVDGALLRAFVDDRPLKVDRVLAIRSTPAPAGDEPVFALGHPGRTHRWNTAADVEFLRAAVFPSVVAMLGAQVAAIESLPRMDPLATARIDRARARRQNSLRALAGELRHLNSAGAIVRRRADQELLIRIHPELADDFETIETTRRNAAEVYPLLLHASPRCDLMRRGRTVLRALAADEAERQRAADRIREDEPLIPELERALLESALTSAASEIARDAPLAEALLAGTTAEARVRDLLARSVLVDAGATARTLRDDPEALAEDPVVALCRTLDALRDGHLNVLEELRETAREAKRRIALAAHARWGAERAPDGDGTLRLSIGHVRGIERTAGPVPARTTLGGLFARHDGFEGRPPFDLPPAVQSLREDLTLATTLCFASTVDITGGFSGAPILDADGRILGVAFDGNAATLGARFAAPGADGRTVALATTAIIEILRVTPGGAELLAELGVHD